MIEKELQQPVVFLHRQRSLLRGMGALDHHPAAMAHEASEPGFVDGREFAGGQAVVEAVEQVRRRIDQRSVEVEHDDRSGHGLSCGECVAGRR